MNLSRQRVKRNNSNCNIDSDSFSKLLADLPVIPRVPVTAGGLHLHRRYRISADIADLLAECIGLGVHEARR